MIIDQESKLASAFRLNMLTLLHQGIWMLYTHVCTYCHFNISHRSPHALMTSPESVHNVSSFLLNLGRSYLTIANKRLSIPRIYADSAILTKPPIKLPQNTHHISCIYLHYRSAFHAR